MGSSKSKQSGGQVPFNPAPAEPVPVPTGSPVPESSGSSSQVLPVQYPAGMKPGLRGRRTSVSAEVDRGLDEKFEKKVIPKTDEQRARLERALAKNFLFSGLSNEQRQEVIDAMEEKNLQPGEDAIRQYEEGDYFYVIDSGRFEVFKKEGIKADPTEPKLVFTYDHSGSFGELALMYNCPRAATVRAVTPAVVWAMDRATFRRIIIQSASKQRALAESFLEKLPILANLSRQERAQVADGLGTQTYTDGEYIIQQGEAGDSFYLLESGEAVATQVPDGKTAEVEVGRLKSGDYFGERAMIMNEARAANIRAVGHVRVFVMDRAAFERLLGPCKQIMQRRIEDYPRAQ